MLVAPTVAETKGYKSAISINIKNAGSERLARGFAVSSGETLTQAVSEAVRERLERVPCVNMRN
jgi:hypothetical protein